MATVKKDFRAFLRRHKTQRGQFVLHFKTTQGYRGVGYPNFSKDGSSIESWGGNVYDDVEDNQEDAAGKFQLSQKGRGMFEARVEIGDDQFQIDYFPQIGEDNVTVEYHSGPVKAVEYCEDTGEVTEVAKK